MPGEEAKDYEVDEENWNAVMLFMAVSTQWRTSMSGLIGLDYNAVRVVIDLGGYTCTQEDFAGLRILEAASLKEMRRG